MDFALVNPIARAILYEGFLLYPYRTSSLKNRQPCAFGSLFPKAYAAAAGDIEPWSMQIECLACGDDSTVLQGAVHFLQARGAEADEREVCLTEVCLGELAVQPRAFDFSFAFETANSLQGIVEISAERLAPAVSKIHVRIENQTPAGTVVHAMLSTHAILGVCGGRFHSLIDPPDEARLWADACQNRGAWPVLIGDRTLQNIVLAAPIILYDFPEIAPESPGNLFDGTEIDELLTLRILTLSDAEKEVMRCHESTRALLERTETLANDEILALHGALRNDRRPHAPREDHHAERDAFDQRLGPGDRVLVRPRGRADVLDLALDGKAATIVSVEQDFEGRVYYSLAMEDDPGHDLGIAGKPGHRFYFRPDELERIHARSVMQPSILIAGVGNIFHGDDAFGSEVARRLAQTSLPHEVRVVDFGIRGHDLAFALQGDYEAVILIDVAQRHRPPGTLSVIEPELSRLHNEVAEAGIDTHVIHPTRILLWLQAQGSKVPPVWLVACEPATFGPEEGHIGLSEPVGAAVPNAVALVHSLLKRLVRHEER